jgi:hypothetical protein
MYSTNGLCHEKYKLTDDVTKRGLCQMCKNNTYGLNPNIEKQSTWIHEKKGNLYTVIVISNLIATKESWVATVVYEDVNGDVWSRPLSEWLDKYNQVS